MTNDVRIGVSADTSSATAGLNQVEQAAQQAAGGIHDIERAAERSAGGLQRLETNAKRLEAVAKTLSKELGRAVSNDEAAAFLRNFDNIRQNRSVSGASKLRQFDSFESWYSENSKLFVNQKEAERYKRRVLNLAAQDTGLAPVQGIPQGQAAPTPYTLPPRAKEPAAHPGQAVLSRGVGGLKMMAGAGLALAGVTSVMAMAGRAVDLAKEESTSGDQLLRSTGDLAQDFETLREKVRQSGNGLGVLYTESAQLGKQFVQIANGEHGDIGENLRTGYGLSRSYGLELGQGVGFMAQARHYGQIGKDDQNGRRFALMIAEAIERGGVTAKAGQVLDAVASFSSQVAKLALSTPDASAFAGALAGLTKTHTPGLDPQNAAQMLMTADNAVRAGGGMGEAGLNFSYGALSRVMPGINPIMFRAVMEQGAFGTGVSGPIHQFMKNEGVELGEFSKISNLELMKQELDRQYSDPSIKLEAIKNLFNLPSLSQAAALYNMEPEQLGGAQRILGEEGMRSLSASGLQNVARIGGADEGELRKIAEHLMNREGLTNKERDDIRANLEKGDIEGLRKVMVDAVAVREQEKNVGTETRDAVVNLNNVLTQAGGGILPVLSGIQEAVTAMARAVAPQSDYAKRMELQEGLGQYRAEKADLLARHQEELRVEPKDAPANWRELLKERQAAEVEAFERKGEDYEKLMKTQAGQVAESDATKLPLELPPLNGGTGPSASESTAVVPSADAQPQPPRAEAETRVEVPPQAKLEAAPLVLPREPAPIPSVGQAVLAGELPPARAMLQLPPDNGGSGPSASASKAPVPTPSPAPAEPVATRLPGTEAPNIERAEQAPKVFVPSDAGTHQGAESRKTETPGEAPNIERAEQAPKVPVLLAPMQPQPSAAPGPEAGLQDQAPQSLAQNSPGHAPLELPPAHGGTGQAAPQDAARLQAPPTEGPRAAEKVGRVTFTEEQRRQLEAAANGDSDKLRMLQNILAIENRGFGQVNEKAVSNRGAVGPFQFMAGTGKDFGLAPEDRTDFGKSAQAASKFIDWLRERYSGNEKAMYAYYNGGNPAANAVLQGRPAPTQETRDYLAMADSYSGRLPDRSQPSMTGGQQRVQITVEGVLRDQNQNIAGEIAPVQTTLNVPMAMGMRGQDAG